jgi:hypothetical protein
MSKLRFARVQKPLYSLNDDLVSIRGIDPGSLQGYLSSISAALNIWRACFAFLVENGVTLQSHQSFCLLLESLVFYYDCFAQIVDEIEKLGRRGVRRSDALDPELALDEIWELSGDSLIAT